MGVLNEKRSKEMAFIFILDELNQLHDSTTRKTSSETF